MNYLKNPLCYSNQEIDPLIDGLFPDQQLNDCVRYLLYKISTNQSIWLTKRYHFNKKKKKDPSKQSEKNPDWIPSVVVDELLSDKIEKYQKHIQLLIDNNIIRVEHNISSNNKVFNIYYMYKDSYLKQNIRTIQNYKAKKKIYKSDDFYQKRFKSWSDFQKQVYFNTIDIKINITAEEYQKEIKEYYENQKIKWINNNENLDKKEIEFNQTITSWYSIIQNWNYHDPRLINEWCNFDYFSGRFHSIFTWLPSFLRKYTSLGKVVEFDMKNCQPTIISNILVSEDIKFKDSHFIKLVENCSIYEDIIIKLIDNNSKYSNFSFKEKRDEAKIQLLIFMYCVHDSPNSNIFIDLYPDVGNWIKNKKIQLNKKDGNKELCRLLQKEEVKIFSSIWKYLLDNKIKFITCHDAVLVSYNSLLQIKNLIIEFNKIIEETIKIKFNLSYEIIENKKEI